MGYFTRVFCTSKKKPKISGIIERLKSNGFNINVNLKESELNKKDWTNFELIYDPEQLPLLVELNQKGTSGGLVEEEIEEFLEFIGKPTLFELKKKKVINHLKLTEYIICIQLPINDIVGQGYNVNGELMKYIELNFSGMIQADNEGFYAKNNLILELE